MSSIIFGFKAFLPLLKQAVSSNPADGMSIRRAAIVNISSSVASLSESTVPDAWYTYKLSKVRYNIYYLLSQSDKGHYIKLTQYTVNISKLYPNLH